MHNATPHPNRRARSPWAGHYPAVDATAAPIRQSLTRYYQSRTDPTRTRAARRITRARQQARALKVGR